MTPLDLLQVTQQTAVFRAEDPLTLPAYKGSTFRGALGHAFRRVSCALRREQCGSCLVKQRCAYSVCFETPVPEGAEIMRKYPSAPHPFVLEPPAAERHHFEAGEELPVNLLLVGRAVEYLPYFIYAFDEMGKGGLGRGRGRAALARVTAETDGAVHSLYTEKEETLFGAPPHLDARAVAERAAVLDGQPLRIRFETPMRVKSDNQLTQECGLPVLAPALVRRLHTLAYFFCGAPWSKDIGPVLDAAREVRTLDQQTSWKDWTRYSARQDSVMQLGGFIGEAAYSPVPRPLLDYLCWGEVLHLGKGSAFGLGKYTLAPATG